MRHPILILHPKYPDQPVTGVPKVIGQILLFSKGKHLPKDEESAIVKDGIDGQLFPEGGSEAPTLQLKLNACAYRRDGERLKNLQNMPRKFWKSGNAHWMCFVVLRPLGLMWLRLAQVSFNPLNPFNPP